MWLSRLKLPSVRADRRGVSVSTNHRHQLLAGLRNFPDDLAPRDAIGRARAGCDAGLTGTQNLGSALRPATIRAMAETLAARVTFEATQPILRVSNLEASVDYYVKALGFTVDFVEAIASVSRGRSAFFLVQGDQGNPGSWVWVGVSDVHALYLEYQAAGAKIRQPPTNFPWACEMQVEDVDGNVLRIGSEAKGDQPYGPWRDMRGELWHWTAGDKWTRR